MAAAAAAAAAVAADLQAGGAGGQPNRARLTLPLFEGKNDALVTRNFIKKVEGYQAVCRLTDAETAQAVAFAMVQGSVADMWLANLLERNEDRATNWPTLRDDLQERFSPALTASEKAAAVDSCKQGKGEDVQAFMDQCETIQLLLDRDLPADRKTGGNAAAYREHFDEGGLKSHVNGALHCTALAEYKDAAVKYERHITKQVKVTVAELAEESEEDEPEVANLAPRAATKKYGGKKKNGKNGNNGNGQWKAATPKANAGSPRLCWSCASPAHLNRDCPDNKKKWAGKKQGGNPAVAPRYDQSINEIIWKAGVAALGQQGHPAPHQVDVLEARNPNLGFW